MNTIPYSATILATFAIISLTGCAKKEADPSPSSCFSQFDINTEWSNETEVPIDGYSENAMEPKAAPDEVVLFWNDKPAAGDSAMNLHYAVKQGNGRYQYIGTVTGTVNNTELDGVAAMDATSSTPNFYFVSTRTYASNNRSLYGGVLTVTGPNALQIDNVSGVDAAVTANAGGTIDMDIDVSSDGTIMVASRAVFSGQAFPDTSRLVFFNLNPTTRQASAMPESDALLANVNVPNCRIYAGNLSADKKELYYTALPLGVPGEQDFRIVVSKRNSLVEPFGKGAVIAGIFGRSIEGPSISGPNEGATSLFYHKFDPATSRYKIYKVTRN